MQCSVAKSIIVINNPLCCNNSSVHDIVACLYTYSHTFAVVCLFVSMDVTQENFKENFHLFRTALNQSDFIAIDGEFSGLYNKLKLNPLDEFSERYELLRKNIKQYMLLQARNYIPIA